MATSNCPVGPMYCRKPIVESCRRRSAAPNMSSGMAVRTPNMDKRPMLAEGTARAGTVASITTAMGKRIAVSTSKPCSELGPAAHQVQLAGLGGVVCGVGFGGVQPGLGGEHDHRSTISLGAHDPGSLARGQEVTGKVDL